MGVPSQTTGHHAKSIYLTQYSTGGQNLVASSGCELNILSGAECEVGGRIEVLSGGELELESGSTMNIDAGATVNFSSPFPSDVASKSLTASSQACNNSGAAAIKWALASWDMV